MTQSDKATCNTQNDQSYRLTHESTKTRPIPSQPKHTSEKGRDKVSTGA